MTTRARKIGTVFVLLFILQVPQAEASWGVGTFLAKILDHLPTLTGSSSDVSPSPALPVRTAQTPVVQPPARR